MRLSQPFNDGRRRCPGGTTIGCPSQETVTLKATLRGALSDNIDFGPLGEISVRKDISAIGNGAFASISNFIEPIDQAVREPTFYGALTGELVRVVCGPVRVC